MTPTDASDNSTANKESGIAVALHATCKDGNQCHGGRQKADERSRSSRNQTLPIDRGWAWVVLIGKLSEKFNMIVTSSAKGFGYHITISVILDQLFSNVCDIT